MANLRMQNGIAGDLRTSLRNPLKRFFNKGLAPCIVESYATCIPCFVKGTAQMCYTKRDRHRKS